MKPAQLLIDAIFFVLDRNRQQGSTTALLNIARNQESFIIAANSDVARHYGPAGVALDRIIRDTEAHRPRSLFFDNYTIRQICTRVSEQFRADNEALRNASREIEVLRTENSFYERQLEKALENHKTAAAAARIQFKSFEDEILDLKMKLSVRRLTKITVKRRK